MVTWQEQQDINQALSTGNAQALHAGLTRLLDEVRANSLLEPEPVPLATPATPDVVPSGLEARINALEDFIRRTLGGK
jgi:hypothetical protein